MTEAALAGLMRAAWKQVRLDTLRSVVVQTITRLEELDVMQILAPDPSAHDFEEVISAVRSALLECSNELREECGLPIVGLPAQGPRTVDAPQHYRMRRDEALENYRLVAFRELEAAFDELPQPGAP